jgi:anti-sigma regulatory factor (Ser/Thr protein kinase)
MTTQEIADDESAIVVLKPVPEAVTMAREVIEFAFDGWGMDTYSARLVVSELVTNALHVSAGDEFIVVRAHRDQGVPTIEVWDGDPQVPVLRDAELTDESGRGLFIVGSLCSRWGVRFCTEGGKVVWAELPCVERWESNLRR